MPASSLVIPRTASSRPRRHPIPTALPPHRHHRHRRHRRQPSPGTITNACQITRPSPPPTHGHLDEAQPLRDQGGKHKKESTRKTEGTRRSEKIETRDGPHFYNSPAPLAPLRGEVGGVGGGEDASSGHPPSHALPHERTVVIQPVHTDVARGAVERARRSVDLTPTAHVLHLSRRRPGHALPEVRLKKPRREREGRSSTSRARPR